jgi:hypothetical protein
MKVHSIVAAVVAATTLMTAALVGMAPPAGAADTTATFILTGGALSISAPASKALGSAATGSSTLSSQLGTTTITDARGALLGSWTGSVTSGDFTTGGGTANETIAKADADYWSGASTASGGIGTFTPGQLLVANKVTLATARTAFSAASVIGNNSVSWNPTVTINVPAAAVAGTYSGTITHSVA